MSLKCGILGLPNVGKSTLFRAITEIQVDAQNYPFCTIEPNVAMVAVPDERLAVLAKIVKTQILVPTTIEIMDIAGLVKGASKGEGLGNKFLSHVREARALIHVVRCFEDPNVIHVEGTIDPKRDIEIIETELALADLESMEKQLQRIDKESRIDKKMFSKATFAHTVYEALCKGIPARSLPQNDDEIIWLSSFFLLTSKPILYVANVHERDAVTGNIFSKTVSTYAAQNNAQAITISANIEADIAMLPPGERLEYLQTIGLTSSGLDKMIQACYTLLHLQTYFTAGEKEVRAWTVPKNATAAEAAGVIHSDFQKGFIRAEVMSYNDLVTYGSEQKVKEAGKLNIEGKAYRVQDVPFDATHKSSAREILTLSNLFRQDEISTAMEVIDDYLKKKDDYQIHSAVVGGQFVGYTCFGKTPVTVSTFDLYWIAVSPEFQRGGFGSKLFSFTWNSVLQQGGSLLIANTSSQTKYAPTRRFYEKQGCVAEAMIKNFYRGLCSARASAQIVPTHIEEGKVLQTRIPDKLFQNDETVWVRLEVDYSNPDTNTQRVFVRPVEKKTYGKTAEFVVPREVLRLELHFVVKIVLNPKDRSLVRRASLPYLRIDSLTEQEILSEIQRFPTSYEAYKYLWKIELARNGLESYRAMILSHLNQFKNIKAKSSEWYAINIEGLIALGNVEDAKIELTRFSNDFPNSWLFWQAWSAVEKKLTLLKDESELNKLYELGALYLLNNKQHHQFYEYMFILEKVRISENDLISFVDGQVKTSYPLTSPFIYAQALQIAEKNDWKNLAVTYAKKLLDIAYAENDLPEIYSDVSMGGFSRSEAFTKAYKNHLYALLDAKNYSQLFIDIDKELEEPYYEEVSRGELLALKGRSLILQNKPKEAEKLLLEAFFLKFDDAKRDLQTYRRFDSGIGGLSIVKWLKNILPQEDIVYFGDTARVPYGTKSPETIRRYAVDDTHELLKHNPKLIIVACNTVSALALPQVVQTAQNIFVLGVIEAGASNASAVTKSGKIAVIGTPATISSRAYSKAIKLKLHNATVTELACPLFVPLAEEGLIEHPATKLIAETYLSQLITLSIDTLVLGCTHYPALKHVIQETVGNHIRIIDGGEIVAKETLNYLHSMNLLNTENEHPRRTGTLKLFFSDAPRVLNSTMSQFIGSTISEYSLTSPPEHS
ncbi:hypothetical protein CHS0354_024117 [Potamilus streckersoni]|uniref:Obg-like ATPase 1 n=1 Tax=Potamilus streckersoni TaxID=2493646 RepID=A0AAE0RZV9_9BIVA|nr:hypothetical protein CHS0354_024117 [Potamilus streckersoni]